MRPARPCRGCRSLPGRGAGCGLRAAGCGLRAAGCGLRAAGCGGEPSRGGAGCGARGGCSARFPSPFPVGSPVAHRTRVRWAVPGVGAVIRRQPFSVVLSSTAGCAVSASMGPGVRYAPSWCHRTGCPSYGACRCGGREQAVHGRGGRRGIQGR
ncbi:hypothetical protein EWI31_29855 [Streptomyces tsukubensis]|nr:hypothetical protein EWI31_29855 [Streptomyces tsukubensis]